GDEPAFNDQDRTDLVKLEDDVKSAGLVQAVALKEIRQRQLWKAIKDEEGKRRYQRFEDYCAERLGHTKQWVTQQTRWLTTVELLASCRAKGYEVPEYLNPNCANSLYALEDCGHRGSWRSWG